MKKVVCFGDSNTFGYIPQNGSRYSKDKRWTGILQNLTNGSFEIIEAGCNNRTGFVENPAGDEYTGYKALSSLLKKHKNLFCIILAIGINDLQKFYSINEKDIENGLSNLIEIIKKDNPKTKIIIASPSNITEHISDGDFKIMFDKSSIEKSKKFSRIYKKIAEQKDCIFIDLNEIATVSTKDGLHYEESEHKKIAQVMFKELSKLV